MIRELGDKVRTSLHDVLASTKADHITAVKLAREVLATADNLAGRPLCTVEELDRRRQRSEGASGAPVKRREAAPVMLYFDGKDHRSKKKLEDLLRGREIPFQVLDVTDDEASRSWAVTAAKMEEFPLLFIAGEPVGGLHEVTQLDVNGGLKRRVFGS